MNKKKLLLIVGLVAIAVVVIVFLRPEGGVVTDPNEPPQVVAVPADWETLEGDGLSFAHPVDLGTSFITSEAWPPQALILSAEDGLPCGKADAAGQQDGKTVWKEINKIPFCVTQVSTPAGANTRTDYAYVFEKDGSLVALIMSLRYIQCGNFVEPKLSACQGERSDFSLDTLVGQMASTFTLAKIEGAPDTTEVPTGS